MLTQNSGKYQNVVKVPLEHKGRYQVYTRALVLFSDWILLKLSSNDITSVSKLMGKHHSKKTNHLTRISTQTYIRLTARRMFGSLAEANGFECFGGMTWAGVWCVSWASALLWQGHDVNTHLCHSPTHLLHTALVAPEDWATFYNCLLQRGREGDSRTLQS